MRYLNTKTNKSKLLVDGHPITEGDSVEYLGFKLCRDSKTMREDNSLEVMKTVKKLVARMGAPIDTDMVPFLFQAIVKNAFLFHITPLVAAKVAS